MTLINLLQTEIRNIPQKKTKKKEEIPIFFLLMKAYSHKGYVSHIHHHRSKTQKKSGGNANETTSEKQGFIENTNYYQHFSIYYGFFADIGLIPKNSPLSHVERAQISFTSLD